MAGSAPGAGNARSARWAALTGLLLALAAITPVVADIDIDQSLIRRVLTDVGLLDSTSSTSPSTTIASNSLPTKYAEGLNTNWTSATVATVTAGSARNADDDGNLTLAADTTLTITTTGVGGINSRSIGSIGITNAANTFTASSGLLTAFPVQTITGTWNTSGSTTVTITGGNALSEVEVGDLIGDANEFERVLTVDTNLSLTVAVQPGAAFSGAVYVIHTPTIHAGGDLELVESIDSDTAGTIVDVWGSGTDSDVTASTSVEVPTMWYAVWLVTGATGTSVVLDTCRDATVLAHPSGYDVNERLIGYVRNMDDGALAPQYMTGAGREKQVMYEAALADTNLDNRLESQANPLTSWVAVLADHVAAPGSPQIMINTLQINLAGANTAQMYVRGRNLGVATTSRAQIDQASNAADVTDTPILSGMRVVTTDGQRAIDYVVPVDGHSGLFIDFIGYTWSAP